jgi:hypothetical protein
MLYRELDKAFKGKENTVNIFELIALKVMFLCTQHTR